MATARISQKKILETSINLAQKRSWEGLCLHDIADHLGVHLTDIQRFYPDKESVSDDIFRQADQVMLSVTDNPAFYEKSSVERLHKLIMSWLMALDPHKQVVKQILVNKLEPGHFHVQVPALVHLSQTIQWIREAAHRDTSLMQRILEETGLTTIFLITLGYWLKDDSPHAFRTKNFLFERLMQARKIYHMFDNIIRH